MPLYPGEKPKTAASSQSETRYIRFFRLNRLGAGQLLYFGRPVSGRWQKFFDLSVSLRDSGLSDCLVFFLDHVSELNAAVVVALQICRETLRRQKFVVFISSIFCK